MTDTAAYYFAKGKRLFAQAVKAADAGQNWAAHCDFTEAAGSFEFAAREYGRHACTARDANMAARYARSAHRNAAEIYPA